ncbi:tetratricopeptide repeat protein [Ilyomonas limi]|uniref:tetratricopeptide repeat protein n=1 Tax=Ilyomonas limi TaxID=2575867 RepID=UPI0014851D52|nr:tetratricopeptide repeat protein [Ilyomonas limi]
MLLIVCSFSSSFAQQNNKIIQQGNEAYKNGNYNAAIKDYSRALETDKKNTTAWFNMGNALQKTMNSEDAAKSYDEAINNATDDDLRSKAYYNKALAMLQQKKLQSAINALKQSLRLTPEDNDARENLQKALNEQKKQQQQQQQQNQKQNNTQQQQQQKQKQQKMMDKRMMEQKFQELRNQEKEIQKQLQQQKASTQQQEKDW